MDKYLILFVEGQTDEEFYNRLIQCARDKSSDNLSKVKIAIKNMRGIGGFKKEALRKFRKIREQNGNKYRYIVALCRDTDVFEGAQHPDVDWNALARDFRDAGADKVIHIKAEHCIEDWFLLDLEGVTSYLRLPMDVNVLGKNGYEKMKNLFRRKNKIYFKGNKCESLVEKLDINKIVNNVQGELDPLFKELGIHF